MVSAITDTAEVQPQTQEPVPEQDTTVVPPASGTKVPEQDWESRFKGIQGVATTAQQEAATLREELSAERIRREALEASHKEMMTSEDVEAYEDDIKRRTEEVTTQRAMKTQEDSLGMQLTGLVIETAEEVLSLGILKDATDLKAALQAQNIAGAATILANEFDLSVPIDMENFVKMSPSNQLAVLERAVTGYGSESRKTLAKLHVKAVEANHAKEIAELKTENSEIKAQIAELLANQRGMPVGVTGGVGATSFGALQAKYKGNPNGMRADPEYLRLVNQK